MSKKSAEERVREKLNKMNLKLTEKSSVGKLKKTVILACITIGALALIIFGMYMDKVREIYVEGDLTAYNETMIIEASGIDIGDSIFGKTALGVKHRIKKNIPMTEKVKIRKNIFTGRVKIDIEFSEFDYFIKYGSNYYAVNEKLVVMDKRSSKSEYFALGARYIKIPDVCDPEIGKALIFEDTVPEDKDDKDVVDIEEFQYIYDILRIASESESYGEMNVLLLEEKFNISAVYSEKYRVYIGNFNQIDIKFKMLDGVLDEGSLQYAEKGIIDLSDPTKVSARAVDDSQDIVDGEAQKSPVDFSEYFS